MSVVGTQATARYLSESVVLLKCTATGDATGGSISLPIDIPKDVVILDALFALRSASTASHYFVISMDIVLGGTTETLALLEGTMDQSTAIPGNFPDTGNFMRFGNLLNDIDHVKIPITFKALINANPNTIAFFFYILIKYKMPENIQRKRALIRPKIR